MDFEKVFFGALVIAMAGLFLSMPVTASVAGQEVTMPIAGWMSGLVGTSAAFMVLWRTA